MTTSELMKAMADAGAPFEAILIAVRALEEKDAEIAAIEAAKAAKRAKDAERKRIERGADCPRTVHGQGADTSTDTPFPAPPNENNLTPPTHTPENNTPRAKADPFPKPDGIEPALWADFLKNRKTKKLTNTATAHAGVLSDLANLSARTGWPPGKVLAACVAKGWGAIYETDEMKEVTVGKPRQRNAPASTLDAVQRAIELTGGASERGPSGPATVDSRAGALPHAVRAIGHVQ